MLTDNLISVLIHIGIENRDIAYTNYIEKKCFFLIDE